MKIKFIFINFLLFFFCFSQAQDNLLLRKISLSGNNQNVKSTLRDIGSTSDLKFSYNSTIINGDSLISYSYNDKTIEECLDDIFDNNIRYKTSGDHIILLKAQNNQKKVIHSITGIIKDSETKQKIQYVSIYDVDERYSTMTNKNGYYKLNIPSAERYRGLCFCKKGYIDTIIVIKTTESISLNIELEPAITFENNRIEKVEPLIEERPLSNFFIPQDVKMNANNLDHVKVKRFAQVSLLPSIGTNLSNYGVVENNFSFNILAGYSKAVNGLEIGSLFNIVKENMTGFQLGGLGNMVGGKTDGVQASGLFNINSKSVYGAQISGFFNTALDTVTGIQLSGFANFLKGRMNGAQVSGFYNMTTKDVDGLQIAGFANVALQDVKLMQIAGFTNVGKNVNGVQLAGFANISKGKVGGAQISSFSNFAGSVNFAQISAFMNIAYDEIKGAQISTFLNLAKDVQGLQLALFNVADTVSGISIGLLSFVRKGYHQVEISGNEAFYANAAFKTGTKKFYNILSAGMDPTSVDSVYINKWYGGYGFGTEITTKSRFYFGPDLTISQVFEGPDFTTGFTTLLKLDLNFGLRVFKKSGISIGPSFNFLVSNHKDESDNYYSSIPPPYAQNQIQSSFLVSYWVGGRLAFRI